MPYVSSDSRRECSGEEDQLWLYRGGAAAGGTGALPGQIYGQLQTMGASYCWSPQNPVHLASCIDLMDPGVVTVLLLFANFV